MIEVLEGDAMSWSKGKIEQIQLDEPNWVTYGAMEAAEKGQDMFGPFHSVSDLMEVLNA